MSSSLAIRRTTFSEAWRSLKVHFGRGSELPPRAGEAEPFEMVEGEPRRWEAVESLREREEEEVVLSSREDRRP